MSITTSLVGLAGATSTRKISFELDSASLAEKYDEVSERQYNHGKLLIRDLGIRADHHVLDVGTGTGRLAEYVADITGPNGKFIGIDPLPLRIEIAKKRLSRFGRAGTAFVGNAEDLSDFQEGAFDVVYYNSVFHWLADKAKPLREAARVLKRGGKVGISSASKEKQHQFDLLTRKVFAEQGFAKEAEAGVTGTKKVSASELESLFIGAGLRPIALEVRTFVDFHADVESVYAFSLASSFGNFLQGIAPEIQALLKKALSAELEKLRTPEGIRLERHLIFAVAEKP
jgi:arsenite methyltransferase